MVTPDPSLCSHWLRRGYFCWSLKTSRLLLSSHGRICGNVGLPGCNRVLTSPTSVPAHAPSMRISMTSFTLKLSSSTSCPTYWYSARHRGPCIRGWGLGRPTPGTGRCPMLRFLCILWAQGGAHHSPRYSLTAAHLLGLPSHPTYPATP